MDLNDIAVEALLESIQVSIKLTNHFKDRAEERIQKAYSLNTNTNLIYRYFEELIRKKIQENDVEWIDNKTGKVYADGHTMVIQYHPGRAYAGITIY